MAVPPEVRPGDVITADFMNALLAEISDLQEQVANLSTAPTTGLAILNLIPSGLSADPIRVGSELRIIGQEFRFTAGGHRVSFDGVQVNAFKPGSNDSLLIVDVPVLPGSLPVGGRSVTLRVENGLTGVNKTITVRPPVSTIQGSVNVVFRDDIPNPIPDPMTEGIIAVFAYRLTSLANIAAEWIIDVVTTPPTFGQLATISDTSGSPLPDNKVALEPGASRDVRVVIPLPAGSDGQTFTLGVSASAGGVSGGDSRGFTVGDQSEPQDATIDLGSPSFSAIDAAGNPAPGASFNTGSNTIQLPVGALGTIEFSALFGTPGTYDLTVTAAAGSTGWTLTRTPQTHTEGDIHANEAIRFTLKPANGATTPTEITYTVQRQGAPAGQTRRFSAVRI